MRGQPHDRSSKRSAAEAVEEAQEVGEALLDKGNKEPAGEPSGAGKGEPGGPGQPVEAGVRLVVDPGLATSYGEKAGLVVDALSGAAALLEEGHMRVADSWGPPAGLGRLLGLPPSLLRVWQDKGCDACIQEHCVCLFA